jgi:hypothetical protein
MKNAKLLASVLIPGILILIGILVQLFAGEFPLHILKFPINIIVIAELLLMTVLFHFFFKNKEFIKFLSSGYAAISSILLFTGLVIIMVLIPQKGQHQEIKISNGFNNIVNTWVYALSSLYILISLGLVIIRRLTPFKWRNIFFTINHFGLWIVLAAASLGQADKASFQITVPENELIWYGYDKEGSYYEPNFAIKLNKFLIDYYPPKLAMVDKDGNLYKAKDFQPVELISGSEFKYKDYSVKVSQFYTDAIVMNDTILRVKGLGEPTYAAELCITKNGKNPKMYYLQNGTSFQSALIANLNADINFVMLNPEPKYFGSEIELFTKSGIANEKHLIEVNKPLSYGSWKIYQTSYFKTQGFDGYISVFTAVYDPWIKVVYGGFLLMLIGAISLIFSRKSKKVTE